MLPVEHLPCTESLEASVILLHGYAASAAIQRVDGQTFVSSCSEVVIPDAPGHGLREDGRIEYIAALADEQRVSAIIEIAREWVKELLDHAAACRERGAIRVGVVGISMGGFAALGTLSQASTFDAVAAVLAAPTLVDNAAMPANIPPVMLGIAGKDSAVRPEAGRQFARDHGVELHEYPESEHLMRSEDWRNLWGHTAAFMRRHLLR